MGSTGLEPKLRAQLAEIATGLPFEPPFPFLALMLLVGLGGAWLCRLWASF